MKKIALALSLGSMVAMVSCSKSNNTPDPNPTEENSASGTLDVRGSISTNTTWTKDKTYRLRGYVYVDNGAKLTIEPGTRVVSNKDSAGVLVIYKGAQIIANGTSDNPIVFTSNESAPQPGDLGGLVLVGEATGNGNHSKLEGGVDAAHSNFGGSNDADNSGVLRYVRIEYGGKAVNPGDEVNGLSLYAIGSGTTIDYVQVVRGLDDAFEFFGGAVNCKHLIAYNCADDDFDMDDGYHGKIQYALSIKDPRFTDNKGTSGDISNNFEIDNTNGTKAFTTTPITSPVMSNFTAIGPNNAANTSADYGFGMRWRRGSKVVLANSIVLGGQKAGLSIESDETATYYKNGDARFYNSFLNAVANPFRIASLTATSSVLDSATLASITTQANGSVYYSNASDVKLSDPFNNAAPNVKPQTGSPALTTAAKFDISSLNDPFFEKVNYIGALEASNDWTAKWTIWNK